MVVKTGAKSSTERAPLRRLSSLEKKGGRKSPGGRIVKEMKGLEQDKAVAPHYQRPTANSTNQARVQFKSFSQSPSPHFTKARRFSLGLESPDACKYVRKSSLLGSKTSEKSPMKINRLKPSKSLEKTPLKINALKPSKVYDKTPGLLKLKTPKSDLCCKVLNVARDTCSSNCKHVVKGGDLTISPEPRCPYHYCSLNHLDHVEPPSVKQFLASRRRLLRTQKSFKWVGLTPVPKGSRVDKDSVADTGHGVETDIVIDTENSVDTDSVVDTGQGLYVVGHGDNTRQEDAVGVRNKWDDDPRPEDCQILDFDDYDDDGLLFESGDSHGNDGIPIDEISMDESEVKMEADESMELFAGDEDVEIDIEAIDHDMASNSYDYDQLAESLVAASDVTVRADESMEVFAEDKDGKADDCDLDVEVFVYDQIAESFVDNNDVKVRADESMEVFAEDKDGKDDDCDLDVEEFVYDQIAESLVDNNNVKMRAEESVELFAEDTDVKDDNHGVDVEASSNNMASNCQDYGQTEERLRFIQVNALESEFFSQIEPDGPLEVSLSAVNSCHQDKVKEQDNCNLLSFEGEPVSEVCTNDPVEQFVVCEDDSDQSEETELQCYIPVNHGTECSSPTEPDCTPGVSLSMENKYLEDVEEEEYDCISGSLEGLFVSGVCANDHIELSVGCKDDYDRIEDPEPRCFIQVNDFGPECNSSTEPDGLPDASLPEANSSRKGEVKEEDECISGNSECGSVSDDSDQSAETELQCYIPVNHGTECSSPTEPDLTPGASFSVENKYLKDVVEEEYDCSSGSLEGLFVSGICVNDHVELSVGSRDDYDRIEDPEPRCFIQVNSFRPECNISTEPDGLPDATLSEANSSPKGEVKEDDGCISGSSECVSVSDVSAYDPIEQSASCQDGYDRSEDTEQQCYILIDALGTDCSSQIDSNGLPNVSFSEVNSCPKDEAKEKHDYVSGTAGTEMASKVNTNGHAKQFVGWEDDQGANGRWDNEITELDGNKCGEVDSACFRDGNLNCHIQVVTSGVQCSSNTEVDSPRKFSVIESSAGPKPVIKEECIHIARSILDGFDDDYNLTNLFAECKDDSSRESESNFPIQFNIPTDGDSPIDKCLFEFSINSKFDEGEDIHTLDGGEDGCAFETHGDDFEEQYLEFENMKDEISRISNDFDDDHTMDPELYNEMRKGFCDISGNSLIGSVAEWESLKSGLKGYKIISEENKNEPRRLKFRQGRVHPFDNQNSEAEKVDLRHQMTEERRAAHEWMLDYALTNIVKKLSPFRQKKVELLVEAFETVTPLSKCETNDLPHATRAFTCSRPIQACN